MSSDPDWTDDWMNPPRSHHYGSKQTPVKPSTVEYLIERCQRRICFGSPGYIDSWQFWSKHDTAEKRDEELEQLHKQYPAWHLRARDRRPWFEQNGIYPPISHQGINR